MSIELDPLQRLLLWRLAVSVEGEFLKDINTSLSAAKRKALVREGFISERKKRHPESNRYAGFLTLEDQGWAWCQQHLTDEIKTRSTQTTPILEKLLKLLAQYLQTSDAPSSLGQFILRASQQQASATSGVGDIIRRTCLELTNGRTNARIRLADLRNRIDIARSTLDETLLEMERAGDLSLYPLDDPQEIREEDRQASLKTQTGHERHLIYYEGSVS